MRRDSDEMTSKSKMSMPAGRRLAYIIGTFPDLTVTFIEREVLEAKRSGSNIVLLSIRHPKKFVMRPEIRELANETRYLLPASWVGVLWAHLYFAVTRPWTMISTAAYLLTRPHAGLRARLKTALHFGEGVYAASLLRPDKIEHIHAHFADRAATVALVAARLLGGTYSLTAHASDIYVGPTILKERIANAEFATTCTGYNKAYLEEMTGQPVELIYHGLDLEQIRPDDVSRERVSPPLILAVGQLKERKGFPVLLRACHLLMQEGAEFQCEIIGDGPDRSSLEQLWRDLGLEDTVTFVGAKPNAAVMNRYLDASIFVLPCVIASNDDRDGIPNVLLEAMANELPIISTPVSGIPEILQDEVTGLMSKSGDEESLADAMSRLLRDPGLRVALGRRGREVVREHFDIHKNIGRLLDLLEARDGT
jgi:glycosyltransferase involved in cell wall biosynthesis